MEADERMVRGSMAGEGMSRGSKEIPSSVSEMSSTTSRYRCLLEECICLTAHCACQRVSCKLLGVDTDSDWGRWVGPVSLAIQYVSHLFFLPASHFSSLSTSDKQVPNCLLLSLGEFD